MDQVLQPGFNGLDIERGKRGAFSVFVDKIWDKDFPTSFLDRPLDTSRNYAPERSIAFSRPALSLLEDKGNLVEDISLAIDSELRALTYLGPLRRQPERDYVWNKAQPGKIGVDGRRAIDALLASAFLDKNNSPARNRTLNGVSQWLRTMNLGKTWGMGRGCVIMKGATLELHEQRLSTWLQGF